MEQNSPDEEAVIDWMKDRVARELDISPSDVDPDVTFDKLGLDSLAILISTGELAQWLGVELEAATLFEFPTIRKLANHLSN